MTDQAASAPAVTVILPFLDEQRFLAGAVDTVTAQTFGDWELLLVDDGSTDGSGALADAFAAGDPGRIRMLRHPGGRNEGLSASRNLGLAHARGSFIAFLDADDRWLPEKLATQVRHLQVHGDAAMTCGPTWYLEPGGTPPGVVTPVVDPPTTFPPTRFARAIIRTAVIPPPPSNVLIRTAALDEVGGVPPGDNLYEDQRTFVALNLSWSIHVDDQPLSTYAVRPDSLYGSLADRPDIRSAQRRTFERWILRYALSRRSTRGIRVAVDLLGVKVRNAVTTPARRIRSTLRSTRNAMRSRGS